MINKPWYEILEKVDRRIIYLVVFIVLSIPFFIPINLPLVPAPESESLFTAIEKLKKDNTQTNEDKDEIKKIALLVLDWDAAVKAECWPQTQAVMAHLYNAKVPFAFMSMIPEGPQFGDQVIAELRRKPGYGKIKYGIDYCNLGYYVPQTAVYRALAPGFFKIVIKDDRGTPIKKVPMMKKMNGMEDIGLLFHCAGSAMAFQWLSLVKKDADFEMGVGVTAIIGPEYITYVKTGQFCGMISGLNGAADYEYLVDKKYKVINKVNTKGKGISGMGSQNLAHLWIIVMMILGNVGYYFHKKKQEGAE